MKIGLVAQAPPSRLKRRFSACIALVVLVTASAAGWSLWRDVKTWKNSPEAAKRILQRPAPTSQELTDAIVVLHRDIARSVELLVETARGGGIAGEQAKIALRDIAKKAGD